MIITQSTIGRVFCPKVEFITPRSLLRDWNRTYANIQMGFQKLCSECGKTSLLFDAVCSTYVQLTFVFGLLTFCRWPVKLDMTKRTDMKKVKSSFTNTQPHQVSFYSLGSLPCTKLSIFLRFEEFLFCSERFVS